MLQSTSPPVPPFHPLTQDKLTIFRKLWYCEGAKKKGSKVFPFYRGGNPPFYETSCLAIVKLGFPQSEVRLTCYCLSHGLSSKSHLLWTFVKFVCGPHKATKTGLKMAFTTFEMLNRIKNSTVFMN